MSLKDELKPVTGKKRRYLLMRVAEIESDVARKMCGINAGTFRGWWTRSEANKEFLDLNRRVNDFTIEFKQEAIQLLRRDNQLSAVLLEEKIITKMKEEIETGEYNLIRTNLARDVYTKLIGELDYQPAVQATVTWDQRIQQLFNETTPPAALSATTSTAIEVSSVLEENFEPAENNEADLSIQPEHSETPSEAESEQESLQTTEAG